MLISRTILLTAVLCLASINCSRPIQPTANQSTRWVLLSAPHLLPLDCENQEPCTGRVYIRAPLADWERIGEYDTFQQCAAGIWAPKPDGSASVHSQGKLTDAEKMLGFKCVQLDDKRLLSPAPYDWKAETLADK